MAWREKQEIGEVKGEESFKKQQVVKWLQCGQVGHWAGSRVVGALVSLRRAASSEVTGWKPDCNGLPPKRAV